MVIGIMDSRKRKMNGTNRGGKKSVVSGGGRNRGKPKKNGSSSDRKYPSAKNGSSKPIHSRKRACEEDEEIPSEGSDQEFEDEQITLRRDEEADSDEQETEQEKRLRLTKDYLRQMEETGTNDRSISDRLRDEILDASGRLHRAVAGNFTGHIASATKILRGHSGHKLSVTCVASNGRIVFSGGKEGTLIKWDADSGKILKKIAPDSTEALGHNGPVLCLSISSDSKFLASGGTDKLIKIWLVDNMDFHMNFKGHRDAVSGVAFRVNTHQLFSCSHDRNVKVWNVDEKAYVETLFGHQNAITAIDSFHKERCVTSGGQDFSVRIWKILEESQLVFQLPAGSLECISLIDEDHFVTGNDEGSLCLWGTNKKKPLYTVRNAHKSATGDVYWITAVDALKNTDMFVSGSNSGEIIIWAIQEGFRAVTLQFKIPAVGFINSLKFISDGRFLVVGVGQEHRLGRWWRIKEAKNSVQVFSLQTSDNSVA